MSDTKPKRKRIRRRPPKVHPPGTRCRYCRQLHVVGRATTDELDTLHRLVADVLVAELRRAEGRPKPNLLSVIVAFLRSNGIDRPHAIQSQVDELVASMPDFDALQGTPPN